MISTELAVSAGISCVLAWGGDGADRLLIQKSDYCTSHQARLSHAEAADFCMGELLNTSTPAEIIPITILVVVMVVLVSVLS